ncbi:MAG: hypothetical protein ACLU9S_01150 [Oscillospiraceae bacterium]
MEDLYRPYRPKRRTRATMAREKGLTPLAEALWKQDGRDPATLAQNYVNPSLGVDTIDDALAGASDILAEEISDDADHSQGAAAAGWPAGPSSPPGQPIRNRTACTACTTTSPAQLPNFRGTRFWP